MAIKFRRGQAFIELAAGMLVLALVMAALFAFAECIINSLDTQRTLRAEAGQSALLSAGPTGSFSSSSATATVQIQPFAAEYIFGSDTFEISESIHIPQTAIVQ